MSGCALGPPEASAQMATSPHKEERKIERQFERMYIVYNDYNMA